MADKTVLAFGTFDGIHPGHEHFLSEASKLGLELVVGVARDSHVRELKNKMPEFSENKRRDKITDLPYVDRAVLSDKELGSYNIIQVVEPDLVAIGHDQDALLKDLQRWLRETGRGRDVTTERISKK